MSQMFPPHRSCPASYRANDREAMIFRAIARNACALPVVAARIPATLSFGVHHTVEKTSMTRRYVQQMADGDPLDDVYLVTDKQLRANRQGNTYLQLELRDRTGSIS